MISFTCDYNEGAHPEILRRLTETNFIQQPGYGYDSFTISARKKIREATGCPDADVYFLAGGTQTNKTIISAVLQSYEGVVAAQTGHIAVHESGAVEFTGHKVMTIPGHGGKIDAGELRDFLKTCHADPNKDHMVWPGMVYISFPTEYGTIYSKAELTDIYACCKDYGIPLFIDGARMGYGLCSDKADVDLKELATLCDVFYIGGTKVGALCGEAVVFPRGNAPAHFFSSIKQHGALLAKGRLIGVQFDTLFTDGLYFKISRHAIDMAAKLREVFAAAGIPMFVDSPTNQQFFILTDAQMQEISKDFAFELWEKLPDGRSVVRFASSWATRPEDIDALGALLKRL